MIPPSADIIEVPGRLHLAELAASDFRQQLLESLTIDRGTGPLFILQPELASDASSTWLAELENTAFRDELSVRLAELRLLLHAVRTANRPVFYIARDDCYGYWLELAWACARFIITEPGVKLGFPELACGAFPAGGAFERILNQGSRSLSAWTADPVLNAENAHRIGLCHCLFSMQAWPRAPIGLATQAIGGWERPKVHLLADLPAIKTSQLIAAPLDELSPYQYYLRIRKERAPVVDAHIEGLLSYSARHYLALSYRLWLQHNIALHSLPEVTERPSRANAPQLLYIDGDQTLPPPEFLLNFSEALLPVLAATDAEHLARSLEVIWRKLEKQFGQSQARAFWERFTWVQWPHFDYHSPVLAWSLDERLVLAKESDRLEALALVGNLCEVRIFDGEAVPSLLLVLRQMGLRPLISTPPALSSPVFVRDLIREAFISECLRCAKAGRFSISEAQAHLGAFGWRFAAQAEGWDLHLIRRPVAAIAQLARRYWPLGWAQETGSVRHYRDLARHGSNSSAPKWSGYAVHRHAAIFAGLLARLVYKQQYVSSREAADLIVSGSLGCPNTLTRPSLQLWPGARLEQYWLHTTGMPLPDL